MDRQLRKEPVRVLVRQEANPSLGLAQHPHLRHPLQPAPFVLSQPQHATHHFQRPVDRGVRHAIDVPAVVHKRPQGIHRDVLQPLAGEKRIELAKMRLVVVAGTLVAILTHVAHDGVLPTSLGRNPSPHCLKGLRLEANYVLFRCLLVL